MEVEAYFQELAQITDKNLKGSFYEEFSREFLSLRSDITDVWLLKDVPSSVKNQLGLPNPDIGIDGVYKRIDGLYGGFQCKFRATQYMSNRTEICQALSAFWLLDRKKTAPPIVISTCPYFSDQTICICLIKSNGFGDLIKSMIREDRLYPRSRR